MQALITLFILSAATLYLVFKWMPERTKQRLVVWLVQYSPLLAGYLKKPSSGCGSGCSSCGSCESSPSTPPKNIENDKKKVIFIRSM